MVGSNKKFMATETKPQEQQTPPVVKPTVEEALKAAGLSPETIAKATAAIATTADGFKQVEVTLDTKVPGDPMRLADCHVQLDANGDVPKQNVTPAEVLFLVADHQVNVKGNPIHGLVESKVGAVVKDEAGKVVRYRTVPEEIQRLKSRYPAAKVDKIFPGATPTLPKTFAEAITTGMGISMPQTQAFAFGR